MDLKVFCDCGQKYAFDVEPVEGKMPVSVSCPSCGKDGTDSANLLLAQTFVPPAAPAKPSSPTVRVSLPKPAHAIAPPPPPAPVSEQASSAPAGGKLTQGPKIAPVQYMADKPAGLIPVGNLGLGILGAILGAGISFGLLAAFASWAQFRLPMSDLGIGLFTGLGARLFFRGTDNSLGAVAAVVTLLVVGIPIFLTGIVGIWFGMIRLFLSVSIAFKVAS